MINSIRETGAFFTSRSVIENINGNVRHVLKSENSNSLEISEIYFSELRPRSTKAWKFHGKQTQNLSVAAGETTVVCVKKDTLGLCFDIFELDCHENHGVLTIPAGIYYALLNKSEKPTILLNATDLIHDPNENSSLPHDFPEFMSFLEDAGVAK
jgi:dTDP-4-dehydrorhamnose 3,5-epimerase